MHFKVFMPTEMYKGCWHDGLLQNFDHISTVHGALPEGVLVVWFASNSRGLILIAVVFSYIILFPWSIISVSRPASAGVHSFLNLSIL